MKSLPVLPCLPCPHDSRCCHWGSSLVEDEPEQVRRAHGDDALTWDAEESEWRTSVVDGRCVFLVDNRCTIHDKPYYPRVCRGFPWKDATGGPYLYDQTICPELAPSAERDAQPG